MKLKNLIAVALLSALVDLVLFAVVVYVVAVVVKHVWLL